MTNKFKAAESQNRNLDDNVAKLVNDTICKEIRSVSDKLKASLEKSLDKSIAEHSKMIQEVMSKIDKLSNANMQNVISEPNADPPQRLINIQ